MTDITNSVSETTNVINHFSPASAAYTFKEWMGVIGLVCTTLYSSGHIIFVSVVHYGGLRKMINDFIGSPISPKQTPDAPAQETK